MSRAAPVEVVALARDQIAIRILLIHVHVTEVGHSRAIRVRAALGTAESRAAFDIHAVSEHALLYYAPKDLPLTVAAVPEQAAATVAGCQTLGPVVFKRAAGGQFNSRQLCIAVVIKLIVSVETVVIRQPDG